MKIAILGGSTAAFEAANAARKNSPEAEIDIYSAEKVVPYRRPALSGMLADFKINEKMFFIKPESFYRENRIGLHLNMFCTAVNSDSLEFSDGSSVPFDQLVIATGGTARLPGIPGSDRRNVYTFRDLADLEKLDHALSSVRQAVIVGAGVLGLELAESMLKRNIQVTVLEMAPRLFANKLSPEESENVAAKLRDFPGLFLEFGATVRSISDNGVALADNRTIPADIVLFAAGSYPNLPEKLPQGLQIDRGIKVNSFMETTLPGIYAAGDVIEFQERCFGLFSDARTTGIIAGTNAAGGKEEFKPSTATPVRCFCFGLKLTMP